MLKQKKLHGQFFNQIEEVAGEEKWLWLRDGSIKRETESLIMAVQEQAIRTNAIKVKKNTIVLPLSQNQNDSNSPPEKCAKCKRSFKTSRGLN